MVISDPGEGTPVRAAGPTAQSSADTLKIENHNKAYRAQIVIATRQAVSLTVSEPF